MNCEAFVTNSNRLVEAMGYWPCFHDARVLKVSRVLDAFTATIHVSRMTSQVDPSGHFILDKHHIVDMTMLGVVSNTLRAEYSRDVLDRITFTPMDDLIQVAFASRLDQDGTILCKQVHVRRVVPCAADGTLHRTKRES